MAYSVPAVETAVKLLDFLKTNAHSQKSLAEVCDALEIPRSTGFNTIKTLEKHGYVRFDPESKRYRLGWALVDLGTRASEQMNYLEIARPYLRNLGHETGLTCILAQRVGDQLLMVDKIESPNDIRATATVGRYYPLAGAVGKALIAHLGEEDIRSYAARQGLPGYTHTSITDVDILLQDLAEVRAKGFAKSFEEYVRGVNVVASPVFDASGGVTLTVAALGLTSSLPVERVSEFADKVVNTARETTMALGGLWCGPDDAAGGIVR